MLALISPNEIVIDCNDNEGSRIAQVESESFEVAAPLFWVACSNDCIADQWYYIQQQCLPLPKPTE
jgi:hypothetical protein